MECSGYSFSSAARSDYAINGGSYVGNKGINGGTGHPPGPVSRATPVWIPDPSNPANAWPTAKYNGLCTILSEFTEGSVTDGMSNTYLLGEKYIDPAHYTDGQYIGDCNNAYSGAGFSLIRWADSSWQPSSGEDDDYFPLPRLDRGKGYQCNFGSAHPAGWFASFCDGSVRLMNFMIDPVTHQNLAQRNDHNPIDMTKLGTPP
jgi:hypothetical protein